uniref:Uncharacterized protein n=1 Tax=Oncorhynchus tshawytscha TaxID=74940 RepID=A0AAZ3PF70_ONCTS
MMCGLVLCPCPIRIWTLTVTNRNQLNAPKPGTVSPLLYSVFVSQNQILTFPVELTYLLYYIEPFCRSQPLFVFDLLGFGHSSRPQFPMDSALAEEQSVSTGAYELGVTWLFLPFPIQVSHLILVDCWGFQPIPVYATSGLTRPGQKLVNRFGPDFNGRFQGLLDKDTIDRLADIGVFKLMEFTFDLKHWVSRPQWLILSPSLLPPSLSLSQVVEGAAHQVYVDQPEEFNRVV